MALRDKDRVEFGSVTRAQVRCHPSGGTSCISSSSSSSTGTAAAGPGGGSVAAAAAVAVAGAAGPGCRDWATGGASAGAVAEGSSYGQQGGKFEQQQQQQGLQGSGLSQVQAAGGVDAHHGRTSSSSMKGKVAPQGNPAINNRSCSNSCSSSSSCHPGLDPRSATWLALATTRTAGAKYPGAADPKATHPPLDQRRHRGLGFGGLSGGPAGNHSWSPPLLLEFPAARLKAALQRMVRTRAEGFRAWAMLTSTCS